MLHKGATYQEPAAFTPTVAARKCARLKGNRGQGLLQSAHEKDMFLVMARPVLETMITVWEITSDDSILFRLEMAYYSSEGISIIACML